MTRLHDATPMSDARRYLSQPKCRNAPLSILAVFVDFEEYWAFLGDTLNPIFQMLYQKTNGFLGLSVNHWMQID